MNILNLIIMLYCLGVVGYCLHALVVLYRVHRDRKIYLTVNKATAKLVRTVGLKGYLFIKTFGWPYFLFFHTNPMTLLSETLFKSYGQHGVTYCGSRGFKNFLNDIFRGKHRYRHYELKVLNIRCVHEGKVYKEYLGYVTEPRDIVYAKVILARHTKIPHRYLFAYVVHFDNTCETVEEVTRYDVDRGDKVSCEQLEERLRDISPEAVGIGLEDWGEKR